VSAIRSVYRCTVFAVLLVLLVIVVAFDDEVAA